MLCCALPGFRVFGECGEAAGVHVSTHVDVHWCIGLGELGGRGDASCAQRGGRRASQQWPSRHCHTAVAMLLSHIQQGVSEDDFYGYSTQIIICMRDLGSFGKRNVEELSIFLFASALTELDGQGRVQSKNRKRRWADS